MGVVDFAKSADEWLRTAPERDVLGDTLEDPAPGSFRASWSRWRGSVQRVADLALTLDDLLPTQPSSPATIVVHWTEALTLAYSPQELVERVDERDLQRARLIEISADAAGVQTRVRMCARVEPAVELETDGASDALNRRLEDAVDLGRRRPVSVDKVFAIALVFANVAAIAVQQLYADELLGSGGGLLEIVLNVLLGGVIGIAYGILVILPARWLLPTLEVTKTGVTRGRSLIRWAVPGLPALVSLVALALG